MGWEGIFKCSLYDSQRLFLRELHTLTVYGLSCRLITGSVASGSMCGICSPAQTGFTAREDILVSGPIMEITSELAN